MFARSLELLLNPNNMKKNLIGLTICLLAVTRLYSQNTQIRKGGGGAGGSATNAVAVIKKDGSPVVSGATIIDFTNAASGVVTVTADGTTARVGIPAAIASSSGLGTNTTMHGNFTVAGNTFFPEVVVASNNFAIYGDLTLGNYLNVSDTLDMVAGKQQGSIILTNFVLMGISNIVSANANIVVTTNAGVLTLTGSGGSGSLVTNANQFGESITLTIKDGAIVTNLQVSGTLSVTNNDSQASIMGISSFQGDMMAFTRATNSPAATGGTNDLQISRTTAAAGQLLAIHSTSAGQHVWTNLPQRTSFMLTSGGVSDLNVVSNTVYYWGPNANQTALTDITFDSGMARRIRATRTGTIKAAWAQWSIQSSGGYGSANAISFHITNLTAATRVLIGSVSASNMLRMASSSSLAFAVSSNDMLMMTCTLPTSYTNPPALPLSSMFFNGGFDLE